MLVDGGQHHLAMTPTGSSYLSQVILAHVTGHVTPTGNYHSTIFWVEKCNTKVKAQYKESKRKRKRREIILLRAGVSASLINAPSKHHALCITPPPVPQTFIQKATFSLARPRGHQHILNRVLSISICIKNKIPDAYLINLFLLNFSVRLG